ATVWGPYALRGEMAYTFTERAPTQSKSPFFFAVVGGDRTFATNLNVNLQFVLRAATESRNPIETVLNDVVGGMQQFVTVRISKRWLHDTLETEVSALVDLVQLN